MTLHLTYLVGEPGVGKTTLIHALTDGLPHEEALTPFAHIVYDCGPWQLGREREGGFGGTDALSLSVQPTVLQFMESIRPGLVIGEGDRLGNVSFFKAMEKLGYELHIYWLSGSAIAAKRREERAKTLNVSHQNEAFVKGRLTKARALSEKFDGQTLYAGIPTPTLLMLMDDPVTNVLKQARVDLVPVSV